MKKWIYQNVNTLTLITFIFLMSGLLLKWTDVQGFSNAFLIIATLIAMMPIALKAWQSLVLKVFSIELLVTLAVIGALYIHEYTESAVVTFLFLFGSYLEARTLKITRNSISKLVDMAPQDANRLRDGEIEKVDIDDINIGDTVVVYSGGTVPVDGYIIKGKAHIIEASITGESHPVSKKENDKVYSSTIIDTGYIEVFTEKVDEDTTFAKIIELVEEAQDARSPAEKFLNRFAKWYTPSIAILSLIVWLITRDLHLAITFLVIACPGALVIGAPVANVAGIGNGAKNGVLIKGGEVIDALSKVDTLVFDKTGTLTKGRPEVTSVKFDTTHFTEQEILSLVGQIEMTSEHHLGKAVVEYVKARVAFDQSEMITTKTVKGQGIKGEIHHHTVLIGNRKLMQTHHITIQEQYEQQAKQLETSGNTVTFIAIDNTFTGIIAIADAIRSDAVEALQTMRDNGIKEIIMLTGDNARTAHTVSQQLSLDTYQAEMMPDDKLKHIQLLQQQGKKVAMAGDGINDAPAIAIADVGLAMGKGGTDISMETADLVLMNDSLTQYAHAINLARITMRILKQNIAIALITVILLLIGIIMGGVNLAIGMFAHEVSVLLVILNAMRLIQFKSKK